ncbi:hotdog fold thioesterase [Niallia oryzisoli]|uniref:hotdog fold thioesterase n=1 Tax=Niallia oryzisoli TaxID=1737571 RepID=UPI003736DB30
MDLQKTLLHSLGIELLTIEKGRITATMPVDDRTRQPFGLLHGGASVALAETVASIGGYELVDKENEAVVGLEINANHIKSKRDGMVTAVGEVIHRGRTTMIWEVKIKDEQDQLICISRCTLAVIKIKK